MLAGPCVIGRHLPINYSFATAPGAGLATTNGPAGRVKITGWPTTDKPGKCVDLQNFACSHKLHGSRTSPGVNP